jgi:hypothetical protein
LSYRLTLQIEPKMAKVRVTFAWFPRWSMGTRNKCERKSLILYLFLQMYSCEYPVSYIIRCSSVQAACNEGGASCSSG